ncbi:MAG TPA: L,D-transpeptidase family protein [Solirubrobacteraceae bacterium]|nr:L,D-transpeptidase family protein [Solirubrobacteraceae bacterium]
MSRPARRRGPYIALGVFVLLVAAAGAVAVTLKTSKATLSTDSTALAKIGMPVGGGTIETVSVTNARTNQQIPAYVSGGRIWPSKLIPAHELVAVYAVVKRPSSVAWLTGKTEELHLTLMTPTAHLLAHFLTVPNGQPLRLQFVDDVSTVSTGLSATSLRRRQFAPESVVTLPRTGSAGSMYVAAAPRTWESSSASLVSWFPAGASTSAIAYPSPGGTIKATTPITLTFNKPVSQVLHGSMPDISPQTQGTWHQVSAHAIQFVPANFGYGLGATVSVGLPGGVNLVGAKRSGAGWGAWTVPQGTTLRLQQLLAVLGYLPLRFQYVGTGPGPNTANQLAAAIDPPKGTFTMRYPNTPSALASMWAPGSFGEMTKGAIMAFENTMGMNVDGEVSPALWSALITAAVKGQINTFGYTFVQVSEGSPESESTWHSGKTVVSGPVNTGVPAAPTAQGTFAVFEHALSVTMSGTNPDGSHYVDPGIPFVSYFNGGDALHYYPRGGYGYPQSDGCVEMPYGEAEAVYPYTPIGTLVQVT